MANVESGDSGSPDFIPYVDPITGAKKLSVLGAHQGVTLDPFLPFYGTNLNAIMNPTGYALKWVAPVAQTWTGGAGSGDFTNSANWTSAMPGISNAVLFDIGTAGGQTVINLGGTQTLNGLYFKNSGGNGFTISNGLLTVDRVGIVNGSNGTLTVQSGVALTAPQTWDGGSGGIVINGTVTNNGSLLILDGTGTNRINGAIYDGGGGLAKDGAGRLILSGSNVLGGSLFVHAGTLEVNSPLTRSLGSLYLGGAAVFNGGTNIFADSLHGGEVQGAASSVLLGSGLLVVSNTVTLGDQVNSMGTLTVTNGQLQTGMMYVGQQVGTLGQVQISGGTVQVATNMILGNYAVPDQQATGLVVVAGGTLTAAGSIVVGYQGNGQMILSNGLIAAGNLNVGSQAGSRGLVSLYGGTNAMGAFNLGMAATATGTVVVAGGMLMVTGASMNAIVGSHGQGELLMSNGAAVFNNTGGFLMCGQYAGSQGQVTLAGGATTVKVGMIVGSDGGSTGTVLMTGGSLLATNSFLIVGNYGNASMTVSNGVFQGQGWTVGGQAGSYGSVGIFGGTNTITSDLALGYAAFATGALVMAGGNLVVNGGVYVGNLGIGSLVMSNGAFVATNGGLFAGNIGGRGDVRLYGGSALLNALTLGNTTNASGVGATGLVTVADAALLELQGSVTLGNVNGAYGAMTNRDGGTIRFTGQNDPTISINNGSSFVVTNATIEFKDASAVNLQGNITNITFQDGSRIRFNGATNAALASYAVGSGSAFAGVDLVGSNATWRGGSLVIGSGGTLNVSNAVGATVGAALTATGDIRVVNSRVTWQSNVVVSGRYFSDPSTNIFATNVTVTASGALNGSNGDLFVFQQNFTMQSTNRTDYNLALASVLFTNASTGPTNHVFDLSGSGAVDMGSSWLTAAQLATNFSIGTLSLAGGNSLTLNGVLLSNALSVGWLDLGGSTNNITSQLGLNVNLYYDLNNPNNAYLVGVTYNLGAGQLIPIPEPSVLLLALLAGLALMRRILINYNPV